MNKKYNLVLNLEKDYKTFDEFYNEAKDKINRSIVELFKGFIDTNNDVLVLHVESVINGLKWDADFTYTNKQAHLLKEHVLPHFEEIEDFDKCIEIREICKQLSGE